MGQKSLITQDCSFVRRRPDILIDLGAWGLSFGYLKLNWSGLCLLHSLVCAQHYYPTAGHIHTCPLSLTHAHSCSPSPSPHCSHTLAHTHACSHSTPAHTHAHSLIHMGLKWHAHTTNPGPQTHTGPQGFLAWPFSPHALGCTLTHV